MKCHILETDSELPPLVSPQDLPDFTFSKSGLMTFNDGRHMNWTADSATGLYTARVTPTQQAAWALISATAKSILRRIHYEAAHAPATTMRKLLSSIPHQQLPRKEVNAITSSCRHCAEQKDNRNRSFEHQLANTDEDTTDADIVVLKPASQGYVAAIVTRHRPTQVVAAKPLRSHTTEEIKRALDDIFGGGEAPTPRVFRVDGERGFSLELIQHLQQAGIDNIETTPAYTHTANARAENTIKQLVEA